MFKKISFLLLLPLVLFADITSRMCADLETIKGIFETQYAPMEWKESYLGWSLNSEIEFAKLRVITTPDITIKDYQRIVRDFFRSTQDFHVNATFFSTESAMLPLSIKSADGRYFVTSVDRSKIEAGSLQVGDEILKFNGEPIGQAMKDFQLEEVGQGGSRSDQAIGEHLFTNRSGALGHLIPQGEVILDVKSNNKRNRSCTLKWDYQDENIKNILIRPRNDVPFAMKLFDQISFFPKKSRSLPLNQNPAFKKSMLSPFYKFIATKKAFSAGEGVGDRESFVPGLGKKLWASHPDSSFHAYLFETQDKHRYGYIRIPEFLGNKSAFEQFKELIERLEKESEALVIDQLNNPGGSLFYTYALLSLLSDRPLIVPPQRIALTQKEIAVGLDTIALIDMIETDDEAMEIFGEDLDGLPVTTETVQMVADYMRFIISQWNLGITFTAPYPVWGMSEIMPDYDVQYTKPILVLINHMDFSCADFFPSILQDNQRATLLGTTTGGAGGFVLKASYPNMFGMDEFTYTGSIAYRKNNLPIENLGVIPDIEYELTVEDLTNFYKPFKDKILEALKNYH